MRVELKNFVIVQLKDGRFHAKNSNTGHEFIVDDLSDAIACIEKSEN